MASNINLDTLLLDSLKHKLLTEPSDFRRLFSAPTPAHLERQQIPFYTTKSEPVKRSKPTFRRILKD